MRQRFLSELDGFRDGLLEMASLVLSQVERAVQAWEEHDLAIASEVIDRDDLVDAQCQELDQRIFGLHLHDAPVATDLRLLHVGLIAVIALERVGDLAVTISRQVGQVAHGSEVPTVVAVIRKMSARAVDALASAVHSIARGDVALGEWAAGEAEAVRAQLQELVGEAASQTPETGDERLWLASSILVGRHLERIANNGRDLGGRVRFLVTGEVHRPPGDASGG